jgi:hypothetical protein
MGDNTDRDPERRKETGSYKEGNTGPDGDYLVGRNRPPTDTRFAHDDGRKRGRRPKGQKNFDTEFLEEAARMVEITENGKRRKVSKLRTSIIRVLHNAGVEGENPAIGMVINTARQIADKATPASSDLTRGQDELLAAWLEQKLAQQLLGDNPGDPAGPINDGTDDASILDKEAGDE